MVPPESSDSEEDTRGSAAVQERSWVSEHFDVIILTCQTMFVGLCSSSLIVLGVHWGPVLQPSAVTWVFFTAVLVLSAAGDCLGQGILKAFDRAVGTTIGGLVGLLLSWAGARVAARQPQWVELLFTLLCLPTASGISWCFWNNLAKKLAWFKEHSYILLIGVLTMGLVWMVELAEGVKWRVAISRICAIFLGNIIALLALMLFNRGSALGVSHKELTSSAYTAADLVEELFQARFRWKKMASFSDMMAGEQLQDPICKKHTKLLSSIRKVQQVLPFSKWEPRWASPRGMHWRGASRAVTRYHIMNARMSRLTNSAIAMDTQIRATCAPPQVRTEAAAATERLAASVRDLLRAAAWRMEAAVRTGQAAIADGTRAEEKGTVAMQGVRTRIQELHRAVQTSSGDAAAVFHGGEAALLRVACGPEVEAIFLGHAGLAFTFLAVQLGVAAMYFYNEVDLLFNCMEDTAKRPAQLEEETAEGTSSGEA